MMRRRPLKTHRPALFRPSNIQSILRIARLSHRFHPLDVLHARAIRVADGLADICALPVAIEEELAPRAVRLEVEVPPVAHVGDVDPDEGIAAGLADVGVDVVHVRGGVFAVCTIVVALWGC
jgi:hypothetical protein